MLRLGLLFAFFSLMLCSAQANDNPLTPDHDRSNSNVLVVTVNRDCYLYFGSTDKDTFRQIKYLREGQKNSIKFASLDKTNQMYWTTATGYFRGDILRLPTANVFIKKDQVLATLPRQTSDRRDGHIFDKDDYEKKVKNFPPVLIYENGKLTNDGSSSSNSRGFYDEAKNSKLRGMFGRR